MKEEGKQTEDWEQGEHLRRSGQEEKDRDEAGA